MIYAKYIVQDGKEVSVLLQEEPLLPISSFVVSISRCDV